MMRLLGLALFSGSLLLLEIGLTRLFATIYYPPTVFAILSLGLLGIGLGAAGAARFRNWRAADQLPIYAGTSALCGLLLIITLLRGRTVFGPNVSLLPIQLLLVLPPFFCAGVFVSTLFSQNAAAAPRLYLADLVGAGLGALWVVPLFQRVGVINGVLAAISGLAIAGLLLHLPAAYSDRSATSIPLSRSNRTVYFLISVMLMSSWPIFWPAPNPSLLFQEKSVGELLERGGTLLASRWDAFARTDLVDPGSGRPYELYIDGAAGSVMPPAQGDPVLWKDIGLFPFATEQPARVFLIGPGGGLDIWFAIQGRAEEIVAAEVNPGSVAIAHTFASYNGDIYGGSGSSGDGSAQVVLKTEDGRSVLEREANHYDLILLSQVVTLAAERAGFALTENHIYTVEAMQTYLAHLTENGQIAFKLYDELTLTRAFATAITALTENGMPETDALNHVMVLLDPNADPAIPLLLVRNSAYDREDALSIAAVAQQVGFRPLFLPGLLAEPPLDNVAAGAQSIADLVAASENDIGPSRDNRPFFFQFEKGLASNLIWLVWGAVGITLAALTIPPLFTRAGSRRSVLNQNFYFAGLGLGFMLIEIALIQQTQLVLGHPTRSISVVLATLLIGGGLGSGLWGRLSIMSSIPLLGIVVGVCLWWLGWPVIRQALLVADFSIRSLAVAGLILPLALVMGMPFPAGLTKLADEPRSVSLAWAIIGVMSVVGTIFGLAIAQLWGYSYLLIVAAVLYFGVWWIARSSHW